MIPLTKQQLIDAITGTLRRSFGCEKENATPTQVFKCCALVLRDLMNTHQVETAERVTDNQARQVHYLSMEFLIGRSLMKNAYNLGMLDLLVEALDDMGFAAADIFELEPDAGLGNGGLGRLAACYLDSMTTLEIPATGYTICYELGIFKQKIVDGEQVEMADNWMEPGGVWLVPKLEETERVRFNGTVSSRWEDGRLIVEHNDYTSVMAVPYDMVIAGYKTDHTNVLRLWDAKSPNPVDISLYSTGKYLKAVEQQAMAEVISKVLYPDDNHYEGKSLRLKQQYFFVSATAQSICRKHKQVYGTLRNFHRKHVIQINDTHPTLVIPELMRILMDQEGYGWDEAWHIVTNTVAYTNHTILAEALERWPQQLVEALMPRIWQILVEINNRYQAKLNEDFNGDQSKVQENAIIWGGIVRMANLCVCACYAVNGVSALHSDIIRRDVFPDAYARRPEKFCNVTNGVDHRRWLSEINPELDALIRDCTGDGYLLHAEELAELEKFKDDAGVLDRLGAIKKKNKRDFAGYIARESGLVLNTDAIFDVQVKRLHEYKRQLLNAMHIIWLYQRLKADPHFEFAPRVFLFGAKAAPGYYVAKTIIHMINSLAKTVNSDPVCKDRLQVAFLENYRVSLAERLIPAAEISEQISTAGKEASGTSNMKFMMNGAVTVGTLDGANVEMHEQVGSDNIIIFGLTTPEVAEMKRGGYHPHEYYMDNPELKAVVDQLTHGFGDGVSYRELANRLLFGEGGSAADEYMLLADFESYKTAQQRAGKIYQDPRQWNRMALVNIAKSGIFAADRSIRDYAERIWHVDTKL